MQRLPREGSVTELPGDQYAPNNRRLRSVSTPEGCKIVARRSLRRPRVGSRKHPIPEGSQRLSSIRRFLDASLEYFHKPEGESVSPEERTRTGREDSGVTTKKSAAPNSALKGRHHRTKRFEASRP